MFINQTTALLFGLEFRPIAMCPIYKPFESKGYSFFLYAAYTQKI